MFALGHLLEAALAGRRSRGAAAAIAALVERCTASAPEARPAAADVAAELRPWACEPDGQLPEAVLGLLALIALLGGLLAAWWL